MNIFWTNEIFSYSSTHKVKTMDHEEKEKQVKKKLIKLVFSSKAIW